MGVTADGYFDWAVRARPRVPGGTNGGRNGGRGMIPHSAVGKWRTLDELLRFLEGRITAPEGKRSSWAATNMQSGIFYQHFSIWDQTWTCGSPFPNNNFFAFENEGGGYWPDGRPNFSEPLTQPQINNIIRVGRDLRAVQGWEPRRPLNSDDRTASLYEHGECVRFGSLATSCPSGRIPWGIIVPALKEDVMPTKEYAELYQRDEDIKRIVKLNSDRILAFGTAFADLARHVYGDGDPRTQDVEQRLKALEDAAE